MIHVNRGTTSLGIFPEQEVRDGLSAGRFAPTDIGWREGMATWQPLSQFPEFGGNAALGVASIQSTAVATPVVAKTEPLAIWSLVLSLVGLFCCGFIVGIGGVVCGHLALSKLQREPQLQGRGLAIAGLIIGYLAILFWLLYIVFFGGFSFLRELSNHQ
jgi:Domain of unknown function (DUF4190)/GYF domain 2